MERNKFCINGWFIEKQNDKIELSMDDYVKELQNLKEVPPDENIGTLTDSSWKGYKDLIKYLDWLALNACPDVMFEVMKLSRI
jgi:hypothetical protein